MSQYYKEAAARYIASHYKPDDWIAIALLQRAADGNGGGIKQEFLTAERAASPRYQAHLRAANANGTCIYASVNALHDGAHNRTKADVKAIRHLYLDIDENGPEVLASVLNAKDLPKPSTVLESSRGKYQVLWRVEGFTPDQAEATVRGLAARHGADESVWDCARILRLPSFSNQKYKGGSLQWVKEVPGERSHGILTPADFPQFPEMERQIIRGEGRKIAAGHHSRSEMDWGRVLRKLEHGEDPSTVAAWLARERPDKVGGYAERTVKKAQGVIRQRGGVTP
ncbi:MAG: hypothetical protein JWN34_372 [Bryobacterales bacterium]|nr:hypothetical protein [Bryobacterales bacterium]